MNRRGFLGALAGLAVAGPALALLPPKLLQISDVIVPEIFSPYRQFWLDAEKLARFGECYNGLGYRQHHARARL